MKVAHHWKRPIQRVHLSSWDLNKFLSLKRAKPLLVPLAISLVLFTFMLSVLVLSGYYGKKKYTGWLINNRNLFLTTLGAEKSWIKVLAVSLSGEGLLYGSQKCLLTVSSHAEVGEGFFSHLFYKTNQEGSTLLI